ncbi:MAG: cobalamin-dependent protein [Deltaproteobacteria bacterium]|nr:cobalamin-dependent protein [Deltaproteobacteria bacterium]
MGKISDQIIKGKFDVRIHQQDSKIKSQPGISELIRLSVEKNMPPPLISVDALDKAMHKSIKKYEEGQFLLPDLIATANRTTKARSILSKYVGDDFSLSKGKAVLGTIYGQDHTNWRDITAAFLKGLGFKTIDLGASVSIKEIVQSVKNDTPDFLGITMPATSIIPEINAMSLRPPISEVKRMIDTLSEEGCRKNVKIMIGGYVSGIESAEAIGADYCCNDMFQTIVLLNSFYNSYN